MTNQCSCCCGGNYNNDKTEISKIKSIIVLGRGCSKCNLLHSATLAAVSELKIHVDVEYITDPIKCSEYDVMSYPAILVNNQVVSAGRVLNALEVIELLKKY